MLILYLWKQARENLICNTRRTKDIPHFVLLGAWNCCGGHFRLRLFLAGLGTAAERAAKGASPLACKLNLKNGAPLCVGDAMKIRLRSVNKETCREVWLPAWRVDDLVVQIRRRRDRGCSWLAISRMTGLSVDTCHELHV